MPFPYENYAYKMPETSVEAERSKLYLLSWLYVEDHCKAIDLVVNEGKIGEVYNVGGHNEKPNIFIVKTIIEQLHDWLQDEGISEKLIRHVEDRLGHDRRYGTDPSKRRNDLGWYPEISFEKGIALTIDWYLEHGDWMDNVASGGALRGRGTSAKATAGSWFSLPIRISLLLLYIRETQSNII